MLAKCQAWFKNIVHQLSAFNETPHQIALSFAIGVFLGILPFTGVLAAISMAIVFRLNKTAAILGSVITNTWLGFVVLGLSVQIGALLMGLSAQDLFAQMQSFIQHFHWRDLLSSSFTAALIPLMIGYLIVSFACALMAYGLALAIIHWHRQRNKI